MALFGGVASKLQYWLANQDNLSLKGVSPNQWNLLVGSYFRELLFKDTHLIVCADQDEAEEVESDEDDATDANFISRIVSLVVVPETGEVLCASANGYGKRTPVDDFPTKKRGGKGVIAIKTSERNGELVGAVAIDETKELMLISDGGTLVRTRASEVAQTGRNAQGVRLIRLGDDETLVGVEAIDAVEEDEIETVESVESAMANETLVDEETIVDDTENESDLNESEEE